MLKELREAPKAEGQERIYTHGEKEVEAAKVSVRCRTKGDLGQMSQEDFLELIKDLKETN